METTGVFEVVVRGGIGPDLANALAGFDIRVQDEFTHVTGPVADQAQLIGILTAFDDLHLEVVSVNPAPVSSA